MKINVMATAAVSAAILCGCAGSASHKVVTVSQPADAALSCQQADVEIMRAQTIINGVNDDKDDVSAADVMDGILWFPFNLIAKSSNYSNALTAANQRIINMNELKRSKSCPASSAEAQAAATDAFSQRVRELNQLYKDGMISEEEYVTAKQKLLDNVGS